MRLLSLLITVPLFLVAVGFAFANRAEVALSFWPLDLVIQAPVFVVGLGALGLGLFLGGVLTWFGTLGMRFEARALRKELAREKERQNISVEPKRNWLRRIS